MEEAEGEMIKRGWLIEGPSWLQPTYNRAIEHMEAKQL
jgi:hypothetical protein